MIPAERYYIKNYRIKNDFLFSTMDVEICSEVASLREFFSARLTMQMTRRTHNRVTTLKGKCTCKKIKTHR